MDKRASSLCNRRVLIVEDEYLLADDLRLRLGDAHAIVIGPVANVAAAIELIQSEDHVDGAIIDVNLAGEKSFPVADLLLERRVPFVFTTGYDSSEIPVRFGSVVRCEKPMSLGKVMQTLEKLLSSAWVG